MAANTSETKVAREKLNPEFTVDFQWADEQQQAVDLLITERRRYGSVPNMLSSIGHERFGGTLRLFTGALGFITGAYGCVASDDPLTRLTAVSLASFGVKTFFNGMDSLFDDRRLIAISKRTELIKAKTITTYSLPDEPNPTTPPQP